ncbi:hypothetical protein HYDPIDRAFT_111031 [Hydnomerulius pinastri MD-312]|uniref:Translation machinery-associated protein 16 n=1 Tax=Hydnomerulius pinastri MD-312 TaxID=994086 RepID=A0A0C9WGB5_9AGAM|nr:hypothetical protein HYDPIDRAFT_111031 [Hydnomerulius pinastri MD-312]
MAPSKSPKSDSKGKKEKIFHPDSRKAAQLGRTQIRKNKLAESASKRIKKHAAQVDVYGFFYHALPPDGVLTLEELHALIKDVWLARHDDELEQERAARRKGRPKSTKEIKLEEIKLREAEEYRTGMEVPDLTHAANMELFRKWDQKEVAFIQLLRFIRVSSADPTLSLVSRPGKHHSLRKSDPSPTQDQGMNVDGDDSL